MAADFPDWTAGAYLSQHGQPIMAGADFPDWTDGVTVVDYLIPAGADFPDWTKVVAETLTSGAAAPLVAGFTSGGSQSGSFPTNTQGQTYNQQYLQAGDLVVAVVCASSNVTWTANNGLVSILGPVAAGGNMMQVFSKIATGNENLTWTFNASANCVPGFVMFAHRGAQSVDGRPAIAASTSTTAEAPNRTASVTDDISIAVYASWHPLSETPPGGHYFTVPAGYTALVQVDGGGPANSCEMAAFYKTLTATGDTGQIASTPYVTPDDGMDCSMLIGPV